MNFLSDKIIQAVWISLLHGYKNPIFKLIIAHLLLFVHIFS